MDTWRAITVIARNLVLTWTVLIPMLFAAVLLTQLYFTIPWVSHSEAQFLYPFEYRDHARKGVGMSDEQTLDSVHVARDRAFEAYRDRMINHPPWSRSYMETMERPGDILSKRWQQRSNELFQPRHLSLLLRRLEVASWIPIAIFSMIVMLVVLWMQSHDVLPRKESTAKKVGVSFIAGALTLILLLLALPHYHLSFAQKLRDWTENTGVARVVFLGLWTSAAMTLLYVVARPHSPSEAEKKLHNPESIRQEVARNRIVGFNAYLFLALAVSSVLLLFGGFGHELIDFTLFYKDTPDSPIHPWIAQLGGAITAIVSVAGSAYTILKGTPKGGGERTGSDELSKSPTLRRIILKLTPPLVLLVMLCLISWLSHATIAYFAFHRLQMGALVQFAIALNGISLYYAAMEMTFAKNDRWRARLLLLIPIGIIVLGWMAQNDLPSDRTLPLTLFSLGAVVWIFGSFVRRNLANREARRKRWARATQMKETSVKSGSWWLTWFESERLWWVRALVFVTVVLIGALLILNYLAGPQLPVPGVYACGILICIVFAIFALWRSGDTNANALFITLMVATVLTALMILPPIAQDPQWGLVHLVASLFSIAIAVIVLTGWAANPNEISLHGFYRSRLVRAYLGASNWMRLTDNIENTHPGDDLPLCALKNCERGAPLHIVNCTLNLVAAYDLASVQRHGALYTMSEQYCGSSATGYRKTREYMSGNLTLGAAAAISGAAISPNMGSYNVSSSLAMLLSFFNIRLGYWAPNPNRERWKENQPHLWPYYMFKEFLSQTTKLSSYVYLTDGGHFDNTGLYSLIERGCRTIIIGDTASDPDYDFQDLGVAIRRCRIDFGTQFDIPNLQSYKPKDGDMRDVNFLTGTFTFSDQHLHFLYGDGWRTVIKRQPELRSGSIWVLKPASTAKEPVDVQQYAMQNPTFPQQSITDQWYDEQQFESYRMLGYYTAQQAFRDGLKTGSVAGL